jgi:hypothetical protein
LTAPAYSSSKDPFYLTGAQLARKASNVTPSDSTDFDKYAVIYCIAAGTVSFVPVDNDDSEAISMTVGVGWQSPWQVRRVNSTGTSATFKTLEKFL